MNINAAWNGATEVIGHKDGYSQSIDKDQAIYDDTGKAAYESYTIITDGGEYSFSADEMENFAKTW